MKVTVENIKRYHFEFLNRKSLEECSTKARTFVAFLVEKMQWQDKLARLREQRSRKKTDRRDLSDLSAEMIFKEFLPLITFDLKHHHETHFGVAFWIEVSDKESRIFNELVQEFSRAHQLNLQLN